MKICEVCRNSQNEWEKNGTFPFTFVYTVKSDNEEHFICPGCAQKRIEELAKRDEGERSGTE